MIVVLCIILVIVLVCYELFYEAETVRCARAIPGPYLLPFLGNALDVKGTSVAPTHDWSLLLTNDYKEYRFVNEEFCNFMVNGAAKYGETFRVLLGKILLVSISDPADVEVVLSSNQLIDKSNEYAFLWPWLGEGLLTSSGEKWRTHRKLITPTFHFKILLHFMPVFETKTDIFIKKLEDASISGKPLDIQPHVALCTLDVIAESAMGVSINAQENSEGEYVQAVKIISNVLNKRMRSVFMRLDFIFRLTSEYAEHEAALQTLHTFTDMVISTRRRQLQEKGVTIESYTNEDDNVYGRKNKVAFLDLLLLSDGKMNDVSIREEVDTFMFEGHDTTSSAITFAMLLIAQNADVQNKIYEEQHCIFGADMKRQTTHSDLIEMKYLEMAIKETIRIYPSVPLIGRKLKDGVKINNHKLPKNCAIVVNLINMNRNPRIFTDPMKFVPERFLSEAVNSRGPYSNVSFSAGPRNCIGQKFAMMEMKMTLSKIIRSFVLKPCPEHVPALAADLILKSANGVYVTLQKRI